MERIVTDENDQSETRIEEIKNWVQFILNELKKRSRNVNIFFGTEYNN